MQGEIVARSYASALFELAEQKGAVQEYGQALDEVAVLLREQPSFAQFIETPRIGKQEKKQVLRDSFGGRIPDQVVNFLLLTIDKRRQRLIPLIAREYSDLVDQSLERVHVDVTVARPLDEAFKAQLAGRLSKIMNKEVVPHVTVNPALVGGIVLRSGDMVYDGSVRRRLEGLRRDLLAASLSKA